MNTKGILRLSIFLTVFFIVLQVLFLIVNAQGIDSAIMGKLASHTKVFVSFITPAKLYLIYPVFLFLFLQIFIYGVYTFLIWYTAISISEFMDLNYSRTRYLTCFVWFCSIVLIISGNLYLIPHSYYSLTIQYNLLAEPASGLKLQEIFTLALLINLTLFLLAVLNSCRNLFHGKIHKREWTVILMLWFAGYALTVHHVVSNVFYTPATPERPNVVILGFDALRQDYLSYFDKQRAPTPHFDHFLRHSTVFTQAYTPDARTFPSWLSILTGQYPRHHQGRDDNMDLSTINVTDTLAQQFQQQGYETIFASDDNRFNNINQTRFGFNSFIGPSGNAVDMLLSGFNDLPLSNLLMTTNAGKILFADFIGNHGTPQLYEFSDFLPQLRAGLSKRDFNKPLLLVAHINSTAWPFFYLQHKVRTTDDLMLYKTAVEESDTSLGNIVQLLAEQGLLKHTIFVLLSDHGITLQLPDDRVIAEKNYVGDKDKLLVKRLSYLNAPHESPVVDTSWGYGTDILSLKQNHALLAVKFIGFSKVQPHHVNERVMLTDIAPTILDVVGFHAMPKMDGVSLKAALLNQDAKIRKNQPFFFETSFSIPEMEHGGIQANEVLRKTMQLYQINSDNALLSVIPAAEEISVRHKQRSVILGEWMLAYYPASERERLSNLTGKIESYRQAPYSVLVNLNTGKWTTNLQAPLAQQAPVEELIRQLDEFYGDEMKTYR